MPWAFLSDPFRVPPCWFLNFVTFVTVPPVSEQLKLLVSRPPIDTEMGIEAVIEWWRNSKGAPHD